MPTFIQISQKINDITEALNYQVFLFNLICFLKFILLFLKILLFLV